MYDSILGSGSVAVSQALTALTICASSMLWALAYHRLGAGHILRLAAVPIALWVLAGSADILVTAKGTFEDATREGNPLARNVLIWVGPLFGPAIASAAWISLWACVALLLDHGLRPFERSRQMAILTLYYSLFLGHLFAFSGWMSWGGRLHELGFHTMSQMPVAGIMIFNVFYIGWVVIACALSSLHLGLIAILAGGTDRDTER